MRRVSKFFHVPIWGLSVCTGTKKIGGGGANKANKKRWPVILKQIALVWNNMGEMWRIKLRSQTSPVSREIDGSEKMTCEIEVSYW